MWGETAPWGRPPNRNPRRGRVFYSRARLWFASSPTFHAASVICTAPLSSMSALARPGRVRLHRKRKPSQESDRVGKVSAAVTFVCSFDPGWFPDTIPMARKEPTVLAGSIPTFPPGALPGRVPAAAAAPGHVLEPGLRSRHGTPRRGRFAARRGPAQQHPRGAGGGGLADGLDSRTDLRPAAGAPDFDRSLRSIRA